MRNHESSDAFRSMGLLAGLAVLALSAGLAGDAGAQEGDARWLPFVGCWEAVDAEDSIGLLCFTPAGGGVDLVNYVDGEVASTGRSRPRDATAGRASSSPRTAVAPSPAPSSRAPKGPRARAPASWR